MSHGLWRNLITVLLYKASSFTVNTAAKGVCDTEALSESKSMLGSEFLSTQEKIVIHSPILNFCKLTLLALICKDFSCGNHLGHASCKKPLCLHAFDRKARKPTSFPSTTWREKEAPFIPLLLIIIS